MGDKYKKFSKMLESPVEPHIIIIRAIEYIMPEWRSGSATDC